MEMESPLFFKVSDCINKKVKEVVGRRVRAWAYIYTR